MCVRKLQNNCLEFASQFSVQNLPKNESFDRFLGYSRKVKLCRKDFHCPDNFRQRGHGGVWNPKHPFRYAPADNT